MRVPGRARPSRPPARRLLLAGKTPSTNISLPSAASAADEKHLWPYPHVHYPWNPHPWTWPFPARARTVYELAQVLKPLNFASFAAAIDGEKEGRDAERASLPPRLRSARLPHAEKRRRVAQPCTPAPSRHAACDASVIRILKTPGLKVTAFFPGEPRTPACCQERARLAGRPIPAAACTWRAPRDIVALHFAISSPPPPPPLLHCPPPRAARR